MRPEGPNHEQLKHIVESGEICHCGTLDDGDAGIRHGIRRGAVKTELPVDVSPPIIHDLQSPSPGPSSARTCPTTAASN